MRRLLLALTILTAAAICVLAVNKGTIEATRRLDAAQSAWQEQTQQLARVQSEQTGLAAQVRALQSELGTEPVLPTVPASLAEFLSNNDVKNASAEMQERILTALSEGGGISSGGYILVTKESLKNSR